MGHYGKKKNCGKILKILGENKELCTMSFFTHIGGVL